MNEDNEEELQENEEQSTPEPPRRNGLLNKGKQARKTGRQKDRRGI